MGGWSGPGPPAQPCTWEGSGTARARTGQAWACPPKGNENPWVWEVFVSSLATVQLQCRQSWWFFFTLRHWLMPKPGSAAGKFSPARGTHGCVLSVVRDSDTSPEVHPHCQGQKSLCSRGLGNEECLSSFRQQSSLPLSLLIVERSLGRLTSLTNLSLCVCLPKALQCRLA